MGILFFIWTEKSNLALLLVCQVAYFHDTFNVHQDHRCHQAAHLQGFLQAVRRPYRH